MAMKTKLLLPNCFNTIGWIVFVPGFILTLLGLILPESEWFLPLNFFDGRHVFSQWTTFKNLHFDIFTIADFGGEILMTLTALGFFCVAFSRLRMEDEWIEKVRLESLLWGFYLHSGFFMVAVWVSYGPDFSVWLAWNMLVAPVVFLVRFHWVVYVKSYFEQKKLVA